MLLARVVSSKGGGWFGCRRRDGLCTIHLPLSTRQINEKLTSLSWHISLAAGSHEDNDGKNLGGNFDVRAFKGEPNFPLPCKSRSEVPEHCCATNHRS